MGKHRIKRELKDRPLCEIHPYGRNPRKNDHVVDILAKSIAANGFNAPIIVDEEGVILAGHTRYKAAQKLGLKTAPCVVITGLGENQKKAFRIADNKIGELARWDFGELDEEIGEIDWGGMEAEAMATDWGSMEWPQDMTWDLKALGFSEHEMAGMQMDADVGRMLDSFEGTSPVRERERQREEEAGGKSEENWEEDAPEKPEDPDAVTFVAKGNYQDFGEDFWKLAGELYARGIKTETKWGKK